MCYITLQNACNKISNNHPFWSTPTEWGLELQEGNAGLERGSGIESQNM
jgi:hypothetical protein